MALDNHEIAVVKGMLDRGDKQHDIAAWFGINQGRISAIAKGVKGENVKAAPQASLPPPAPYMAGRSSLKARETLAALRELIDGALQDIDTFERRAKESD